MRNAVHALSKQLSSEYFPRTRNSLPTARRTLQRYATSVTYFSLGKTYLMQSFTLNPRQNLLVFENEKEAISFCTRQFVEKALEALKQRSSFSVALSGGSTPKKFFESLSQSKEALELPWEKVALFWSDERAVSPDHPDSNFGMAMQFLSKEPFNEAKAFRMEADRADKE